MSTTIQVTLPITPEEIRDLVTPMFSDKPSGMEDIFLCFPDTTVPIGSLSHLLFFVSGWRMALNLQVRMANTPLIKLLPSSTPNRTLESIKALRTIIPGMMLKGAKDLIDAANSGCMPLLDVPASRTIEAVLEDLKNAGIPHKVF